MLWAFAFVQPLFDALSRNPEFFVARRNTGTDIVILALVLTFVPPLLLTIAERLTALASAPLARGAHLVLVGALGAAFSIGLLKRVEAEASTVLLPAAAAASAAIVAVYRRSAIAQRFLTALAPAPAVFVALFVLLSPVSALVLEHEAPAAGATAQSDTPVIVVIFDELPTISLMDAGKGIDAASYPGFARLAATSTWYRNATTVADGTYMAVPAILAGQRPSARRLPIASQYPQSVFTMLEGSHEVRALEPITQVCPQRICARPPGAPASARLRALVADLSIIEGHLLLPGDLAADLAPVDRGYEDFGAEERGIEPASGGGPAARAAQGEPPIAGRDVFARRLREGERFVRSIGPPGARPPLYVAHFEVPHVPWRLLPSGHQYPAARPSLPGLSDQTWTRDRFVVEQAMQRHLLQVGYADRLLERLVQRLQDHALWDRALVVVTADHGVGLRPGGSRRPVTAADYAGIAGVPLFVKLPQQRNAVIDDAPARTIDVLATIASVLGVPGHAGGGVPLNTTRPAIAPSVRNGRRARFVGVGALDAFVRARDAELARQRRLLPRGLASVFDASAAHPLVGRRVAILRLRPGPERARIDRPGSFARVQPRSGVLPVYVSGHLPGAGEVGQRLAVAVNGRIRATGRSYLHDGERRFSMLVPPSSLRPGRNTVDVLALEGGARVTRLSQRPAGSR